MLTGPESPESFTPTAQGSTGDSGMQETLQVAFRVWLQLPQELDSAGGWRLVRPGVTLRERR